MCTICKDTLKWSGVTHIIENCPLRKSWYCSYCAKTGHLTKMCTAKPRFRKPTFMEQLIPPSDLKIYNITSKTPLHYTLEEPQQLLEIKNDDKAIVAYLAARSIKVGVKDKRHKLEEYAKLNNKRLVYIE